MIRALVVSIAVLASIVPPAATAPSAAVPAAWRADDISPLEELLDVRGSRISVARFSELQAGLLRAGGGGAMPEFVFPSRAGDLDGDGLGDVLTVEFTSEEPTLRARRGTDGSELWSLPHSHFGLPVELGGDAGPEILTLESVRTALAGGAQALQQRVSLRNADGSPVWTADITGASVRANTPAASAGGDLEFVAALRVMPDATGDGRPEVFVGTLNFVFGDGGVHVQADTFTGRTIDAATGLEAGRATAAAIGGLPWVVPASDIDGDHLADVYAISGLSTSAGSLAAASVHGVPHWIRQIPTGFTYPAVHDADGDGLPDAILQSFFDGTSSRIAYGGAGGAELWRREDRGYIAAAGDVDGDGGSDFVRLETAEGSFRATAWSGKTGADLWSVLHGTQEGAFVEFCLCPTDLSGDGIWDPLTAEILFGEDVRLTVRAIDGKDGGLLWRAELSGSDGFPLPLGADADGDGAQDVGLSSVMPPDVMVRVYSGNAFSPIWSSTAPGEGTVLGFYGDDIAGDGDPEIVTAMVKFAGEQLRGSASAFDPSGRMWSVP